MSFSPVRVAGGSFLMGSDAHYPEERPQHLAHVEGFVIDPYPVTNDQFAAFVAETGYVTTAERPVEGPGFERLTDAEKAPGSLCFTPTSGPVNLRQWRNWWRWQPGASWRHPQGPDSSIDGAGEHPVVQVSYTDALAYAAWAGRRLPTEVEWEYACRGGLSGFEFAWGEALRPDGVLMANTWNGSFPYRNTGANGWVGTSPVGSFPPNGFGLYDTIGNVWEWTSTTFGPHRPSDGPAPKSACACSPQPRDPDPGTSRVTKGGSHLCAPEYCMRYRPAARSPQTEDSATTHLGFRLASDLR